MPHEVIRLAIDGEAFCWNPNRGIPRVYREHLSRVCAREEDIAVSVAVQADPMPEFLSTINASVDSIPFVPATWRPWRLWSRLAPSVNERLVRNYWRRKKMDVFHSTAYRLPPPGVPSVCLVHDMIPELFPDTFPGRPGEVMRERRKAVFERATLILCVSRNTRHDLVRLLGIDDAICRVAHDAAFLSGAAIRDDGELHSGHPFLLYVGGYRIPYKNFRFILRCLGGAGCSEFSCYDLVVVGPEKPTPRELSEYASLMPLDRLHFLTGCSDDRLSGLYRRCSALVFPSRYEGFGLPLVEALSVGAPVVCSTAKAVQEVGGDAVCFFDPDSPEEFRSALRCALNAGRGADAVQRRTERAGLYSWDRSAAVFAQAIRDAAGLAA